MRALLAVDLRKEAESVVRGAADWVNRLGATVDLVYVDELRTSLPQVSDSHVRSVLQLEWERLTRDDEAALERLLSLLPAERRGAVHVTTGAPAAGIVALAPQYDVLVVSTHGRTGLAHFWLGSVAERVVRTCPKPVFVLRV